MKKGLYFYSLVACFLHLTQIAHAQYATSLGVGIPFSDIGKKRLNWTADNYNTGGNMTYRVGATPNGAGIALSF